MLRLITEDKLPDTEWPPRIVDSELSVSEEIVDRGRMYSTRSEKPTRTRGTTLGGESPELVRVCSGLDRKSAVEVALLDCVWPKKGLGSLSRGVAGALPPRLLLTKSFGCIIACRSWQEMAPDLLCLCPRAPGGGPNRLGAEGAERTPSLFVGLVLISPVPPLPSPPMNSLPPLRWPIALEGVVGEGRAGE